jgi:hypothetical protein
MKWKITTKIPKEKVYLNPDEVILELVNCKLHNNKKEAEQIYNGGYKRVCSWIECDDILICAATPTDETYGEHIHYNPRTVPHWYDESGNDLDGKEFEKLITYKNRVYIKK